MNSSPPLQANANLPRHLGYLDGLRAAAALFVVWHHAYLQVSLDSFTAAGPAFSLHILRWGNYAVDLFIVLSGFCLMLPVVKGDGILRGGAWRFFKRRARRILPPYYLSMAFSLLLICLCVGEKTGTHWDLSLPVTTDGILAHLVLMHDVVGQDYKINHVFWSIAVEWRIYFLFPLLVLSWQKIGSFGTALIALAASLLLYVFIWRLFRHSIVNSLHAHYIGLFVLGMLAASLAITPSRVRRAPWSAITLLLTALMVMVSIIPFWRGKVLPEFLRDYVVGLWSMALLILLSLDDRGILHRALSWRPLAFTGTFAYSIYLIHAPLLQVLWQYLFTPLQADPMLMFAALMLLGTPLIVAASWLFFVCCERPFITRKKI